MSKTLAIDSATQPKQQHSMGQEPETMHERIKVRAYELYEARGRADGHHEQDWYQAEKEIRNQGEVHRAA